MQVLGIVAADADAGALAGRLAGALAERGRVGVVRPSDGDAAGAAGPDHADAPERTVYELGDGGWSACGTDGSLRETLDRLAVDHDYAVVVGFPGARVPYATVGDPDQEIRGEVVYRAPDADAFDAGAAVDALEAADAYETLESLVARVKRSEKAPRAGAIATFTGRVRAKDAPGDEWTDRLEFEKYEGVAEDRLAALRAELEARDGVLEVRMHHRTGVVEYGEDIVFVVVLAGHRREAFRTVEDGIDRLKEEVPIFKKEVTADGEFWVHERA